MNNNEPAQSPSQQFSHEEISRRAEELWRQQGCPQGRDDEIWYEAERQLRDSRQSDNKPEITTANPLPSSENVASAGIGIETTGPAIGNQPAKPQQSEFMQTKPAASSPATPKSSPSM